MERFTNIAMQGVIPTSQPFARYERFPMQAGDNDVNVLKAGTFIETVIETEGRCCSLLQAKKETPCKPVILEFMKR